MLQHVVLGDVLRRLGMPLLPPLQAVERIGLALGLADHDQGL